jgi:hypothetical protein
MLDNEKKKIIEAEEQYRRTIAAKLGSEIKFIHNEPKKIEKDFWSKVIELLNSNFGLWFLSTIFITGGATLYQIAQHHYEAKLNTQKELLTCEFEIANRLSGMKFLLLKAKTNGDAQTALAGVNKSLGAVSIEYEHVNIAVLYFKIFQLTRIRDTQLEHYVTELEQKNLAIQSEDPKTPFSEADRKKLIELISALQLSAQQQIEGNKNNRP